MTSIDFRQLSTKNTDAVIEYLRATDREEADALRTAGEHERRKVPIFIRAFQMLLT